MKNLSLEFAVLVSAIAVAQAGIKTSDQASYLHALSDLKAARWLMEHRPGNWQQTTSEINAIKEIDEAIKNIKGAAIDDNKAIDEHPIVDEKTDRIDRLHEADDFLKKAHIDVDQENDDSFGNGLRDHLYEHIDAAMVAVKTAIYLN
jgi:hypothetical protein